MKPEAVPNGVCARKARRLSGRCGFSATQCRSSNPSRCPAGVVTRRGKPWPFQIDVMAKAGPVDDVAGGRLRAQSPGQAR